MLIATTALGLGFNYDTLAAGDSKSRQPLLDYFGVPAAAWYPQGIIGLGKPGKKHVPMTSRKPENLIYSEYWGNRYEPAME